MPYKPIPHPTDLTPILAQGSSKGIALGKEGGRGLFAPIELAAFHSVSRDGVEAANPEGQLGDYGRFHLSGKIELLQWYVKSVKIIFKY